MPTAWASTPTGSVRRATITVRTVFSCVASRNRGWARGGFTLEPGGLSVRENLLRLACGAVELWGLNDSLSSPPLKPRGLLLSVMRQKVGKERSQGDCHPLGHPPLLPELGRNNSSKTPRGRVALPPGRGVPRGTRKLELTWHSPLAPTEKLQLESNRAHRARESPPPRAARATFTTFFRSAAAGDPLLDKNRLGPPYFSAQRSLSARLGKSFPINSPFIGLISS
jgi:hypothetical protein